MATAAFRPVPQAALLLSITFPFNVVCTLYWLLHLYFSFSFGRLSVWYFIARWLKKKKKIWLKIQLYPPWFWSRELAHHLFQCGTLECVTLLFLPHLWSSQALDEKPDSEHTCHFRDGRLWGGANCTCSKWQWDHVERTDAGEEVRQDRGLGGGEAAWLFAEGGEDHLGRVKKKERRDLKWVCEGTNTDRLQREKSACSSLRTAENKHTGKWEKMRRWRSRSSDGCPGDI